MGKIGIFVSQQHGDIGLSTCVLKHKDLLWPGKDIVWFCSLAENKATYLDMLKFNDAISEIRDWPKFTSWEHLLSCKDKNGQLILNKRAELGLDDLDNGYWPAPWCVLPNNDLNGVNYSEIPRMVYGADPSWAWHPYLGFSNEERERARDFCSRLPHAKTVLFETELRSAGMFQLADDTIRSLMKICRDKFGKCNFIFASKIDHTKYVDDIGVVSGSQFTVRQMALVHNYCDLMIGVCSGITVACCCWGNKGVPRVELCGTPIKFGGIANGPVTSVICDNFSREQMKLGLEQAVTETLKKI